MQAGRLLGRPARTRALRSAAVSAAWEEITTPSARNL